MQSFIDERRSSGSEDGPVISVTPRYLQLEVPIDTFKSAYIYFVQRNEGSYFVATCWDNAFDTLIEELDEEQIGHLQQAWPDFLDLLSNGINDRYRDSALIRLEDPDDGETKWFVASVCGNLDPNSAEGILNERSASIVQTVLGRSLQLLNQAESSISQLNELRRPSLGKTLVKVGVGVALGVLASALGVDLDDLTV
ncbi:MAG: hypothetical protein JO007_23295 [Alphaproteobacteria bacterium]|nr:hypothetical protein [Alphaproteobacteria bacterium]